MDRWWHPDRAFLHRVAQVDGETAALNEVFGDIHTKFGTVDHPAIVLNREEVFQAMNHQILLIWICI